MKKDYILRGELISLFVETAFNTLYVAFILTLGNTFYQLINTAVLIISTIVSKYIQSHTNTIPTINKHTKKFFQIETIINSILIVLILIFKTASIIAIVTVITTPLNVIQQLNNTHMINKIFNKEQREKHDTDTQLYSHQVKLIASGIAIVLNVILKDHLYVAGIALCVIEIINNRFYIKAYNKE